jgi:hypothetical protein
VRLQDRRTRRLIDGTRRPSKRHRMHTADRVRGADAAEQRAADSGRVSEIGWRTPRRAMRPGPPAGDTLPQLFLPPRLCSETVGDLGFLGKPSQAARPSQSV